MIWLYRILFFPALLLMLPCYLLRMWRRGGYGPGFSQRFGGGVALGAKRAGVRRVWIQAVSVGEMQAIAPLLGALKQCGNVEVYLTTTTSTGHKIALDRFGGKSGLAAGIGYFPLDWWAFSARAWRRVQPDLVILMEGELWPEHIAQARGRGVPVLVVNARMSDRSFARMKTWRRAVMPLLQKGITRVLACSEGDAARFRELGFTAQQVAATGNIKWDVTIPALGAEEKAALMSELGLAGAPLATPGLGKGAEGTKGVASDAPTGGVTNTQSAESVARAENAPPVSPVPDLILLGSSTWPGEEEACVAALRAARAAGVSARLLLVPRHAERRGEVEAMLQKEAAAGAGVASAGVDVAGANAADGGGLTWHFRSRGAAPAAVDVAVGDTTGELRKFTQLADLVFVGKSLAPHTEGQTPIEAAALGRAIVFGSGMSNFREISRRLVKAGAAREVRSREEFCLEAARILGDAAAREKMMASSEACYRGNQGAVARTVAVIGEFLRA